MRKILILFLIVFILLMSVIIFFKSGLANMVFNFVESMGPTGPSTVDSDYLIKFRLRVYSFLIGVSLIFGLLGFLIAKHKKEDAIKWAIICFFINILGLLVLIFKRKKE